MDLAASRLDVSWFTLTATVRSCAGTHTTVLPPTAVMQKPETASAPSPKVSERKP
jgi:hypothetical protein